MECAKWENDGLLFTSGELDAEQKTAFEKHLETCEFCSAELADYRNIKRTFFAPAILQENVPAELDRKISSALTSLVRPTLGISMFTSFIKKGTFAVLFLVCGFVGGMYIAMNTDLISSDSSRLSLRKNRPENRQVADNNVNDPASVNSQLTDKTDVSPISAKSDSAQSDSTDKSSSFSADRRGHMNTQGVVPVDLQNK